MYKETKVEQGYCEDCGTYTQVLITEQIEDGERTVVDAQCFKCQEC